MLHEASSRGNGACNTRGMQQEDQTRTIGTRRGRAVVLGLMVIAALAAVFYLEPDGGNTSSERGPWIARTGQQAGGGAVGTTGADTATGADNNSGPPAISPPPAAQDARAAITGDDDWQDLLGRRVTVAVPLREHMNDVAFWAEADGQPLLVVLARDQRDGATRQRGEPASLDTAGLNDATTVSGVIRRLPDAEGMFGWRLTNHDFAELARRPVYLHVDDVGAGAGDRG